MNSLLSQSLILGYDPSDTAANIAKNTLGCIVFVVGLAIGLATLTLVGYSGTLSLLMLVQLIGSIILLIIPVFVDWPINRKAE